MYRYIRMVKIIRKRHQCHRIIPILWHLRPRQKIKEASRVHNHPMVREQLFICLGEYPDNDIPCFAETGFLCFEEVLMPRVGLVFSFAGGYGAPGVGDGGGEEVLDFAGLAVGCKRRS